MLYIPVQGVPVLGMCAYIKELAVAFRKASISAGSVQGLRHTSFSPQAHELARSDRQSFLRSFTYMQPARSSFILSI